MVEIVVVWGGMLGVELISLSLYYDIYFIEDLGQLIYDVKVVCVCVVVKLVSFEGIGIIVVGVVKVGVDVINVVGNIGGIGVVLVMLLKYIGWVVEIGIVEVYQVLCVNVIW